MGVARPPPRAPPPAQGPLPAMRVRPQGKHQRRLPGVRDADRPAGRAGVPVVTEITLFIERCPATIVGVTGTKGKSTTTALLGRMLETRFQTFVGGNIGKSLLPDLPRIGKQAIVVLELSSFMLQY